MKCQVCDAEAVHSVTLLSMSLPLCRTHLFSTFRRFKCGDKEAIKFRCEEIIAEWEVKRKHKNRSKVDEDTLRKITDFRCSGLSVSAIADKIGIAKSLVHRYVTRLEDVYE